MKIAIVYDWIDSWGGAERILIELEKLFPNAHWYTSTYDKNKTPWFKVSNVKTSFINKFPSIIKTNRLNSLIFYPFAFESFDFSSYDLVLTITSGFAKGVITRPETRHICMMLTPTRFLWGSYQNDYMNAITKIFLSPYVNHLKKWDLLSSQRPDKYIAISKTVQNRITDIYHKDSSVIYPPFNKDYWKKIKPSPIMVPKKFYLVVSRLEKYKKIELAIKAIEKAKKQLVIVGKGSQFKKLQQKADSRYCTFLGNVSDEELAYLYCSAEAFIMSQEEDFGYTSLEAQFFGCPVIAYKKGGATETVIEEKTGIFFFEQTLDSLENALAEYDSIGYNLKEKIHKYGLENINKFSSDIFRKKILDILNL